ncbi:CBN-SGCB-1 protein [Caenorhabditis brenneri]|uniref:Beta-sarcoglycan n=1 Tax=Caenorhabditis brenneri TaxID=135651 RepID=G0N4Q6_CAEBE|nr:CBN-SGCB-1 protein [Caenorhabditis brenneri]
MDSDDNENVSDENIRSSLEDEVTGLRAKRLIATVICLFVLFIITLVTLGLNIWIITTLRMSSSGIPFLRFYHSFNEKTKEMEKVIWEVLRSIGNLDFQTIEMSGNRIQFEKVVSNKIYGFPEKDISISAPRLLMESRKNDSLLAINEKLCKLEKVNNFQVLSPKDGRTLFSARHPTVTIDKRIKKLAAERIITNKIRSAVDETLKVNGENVVLRGNEQVRIDARNVNFEGMKRIVFNISRDGILHMRGRVRLGDGTTSLPMSTSPSLSASLDGMRLCACAQFHHKLFIVPANKHCFTSNTFCS